MNVDHWKKLYTGAGFFWNGQLEAFLQAHGGKEYTYLHHNTGDPMVASFHPEKVMGEGRRDMFSMTATYLGEDIVPVGICHRGYVELLLSESGNLFGFADYLLLTWKTKAEDGWRASMERLLEGRPSEQIGVVG